MGNRKPATASSADTLTVEEPEGTPRERALAAVCLDPIAGAAANVRLFNHGHFGLQPMTETFDLLREGAAACASEGHVRERTMLFAQAATLNAIFTEMARRSAINMGEYLPASETYMRLALKAQSQCRATIEALDRLDRGGVQTVKHVHVDNRGGQAVIAETVQTGGAKIGKSDEQPYALQHGGPSVQCADPDRATVPISRND